MISLVGHIRATHHGCTFNDNMDGTFTQVGTYELSESNQSRPPVVVSQNPISLDASPPRSPWAPHKPGATFHAPTAPMPTNGTDKDAHSGRAFRDAASKIMTPAPKTPADPVEYLHRIISPRQVKPENEVVRALAKIERKRDLPDAWITHHKSTLLDWKHYVCALAFLTGDEVTGLDACKRLRGTACRLSDTCVALPDLPPSTKALFSKTATCIGCRYWCHVQRQSNPCDWAAQPWQSGIPLDTKSQSAGLLNRTMDLSTASLAQSKAETDAKCVSSDADSSVLREGGRMDDEDEMETWEVAPGRVVNEQTGNSKSALISLSAIGHANGLTDAGFSGPFLRSRHPVPIAENTGLNIIFIKPGVKQEWRVDATTTRICVVGSGKVKVAMGGQVVQYGLDSVVVIAPGQACTMENRQYREAKIYCLTQRDIGI